MPPPFDLTGNSIASAISVKYVGYLGAAAYLNTQFPENKRNLFFISLVCMALGVFFTMVTSVLFNPVHWLIQQSIGSGFFYRDVYVNAYTITTYTLLVLFRLIGWGLIIVFFYSRKVSNLKLLRLVLLGTIYSFLLDIPSRYLFEFFETP